MPVALGTRVLCKFGSGEQEFPGTISACYSDSTYAIDYDDGDSEDRVDRSLIRPLPAAMARQPVDDDDDDDDLAALEQAQDENRTLRKQIAQMISLSQEEDQETEQLMQSMNTSLVEARALSSEKDGEIERMQQSLAQLNKAHKQVQQQQQQQQSKGPTSAQLYQQSEELRAELKKARDGEAAARRSLQQAKSELAGKAQESALAAEASIGELLREINHLREGYEGSQSELGAAVSANKAMEAQLQEERAGGLQRLAEQDLDLAAQASRVEEAEAQTQEWVRRHKEVQALSDQAYEIMRNEISSKDDQLTEMHSANARLARQTQQAQEYGGQQQQQQQQQGDLGGRGEDFESAGQQQGGSNLDKKKAQQAERAAARMAAELEREKGRFEAEGERTKAALAKVTREKAELAVVAERNAEAVHRQSSEVERLRSANEAHQQQNQQLLLQQKQKSKASGELPNSVSGSGAAAGKEEQLGKEVKLWRRKHRELSDLSDEAYAIMSEQLREKDQALADLRTQLTRSNSASASSSGPGNAPGNAPGNTKALADTTNQQPAGDGNGNNKGKQQQQQQAGVKPLLSPVAERVVGGSGEEEDCDEEEASRDLLGKTNSQKLLVEAAAQLSSPQATSELAASLNKLKQKWNKPSENGTSPPQADVSSSSSHASSPVGAGGSLAESSGDQDTSLFSSFLSPSQKKQQATPQDGDGSLVSEGEGGSPVAHAAKAAALHLAALEKEVADAHGRESELREDLVKARAEVRRLRAVLTEQSGEKGGADGAGGGRGICGAGDGDNGTTTGAEASEVASFAEVKKMVRQYSQALMEGDESVETNAEYSKWESLMASHPEYHEEQLRDQAAFLAKHAKRNRASLESMRRFLPPNVWTTSFQAFAKAASDLPEKLVQHLWNNKILWWVRLDPKLIAKIHIADLRSKYLIQNLDIVEMRSVMACLPDVFENDTSHEKSTWKASILDTIRSALKQEESKALQKNKVRNRLYFKGGPLRGPFDPDAPLHSVAVTQSEAFAPTPQFVQVSRIDDNEELRNRRSSITGAGNGSDSDSSSCTGNGSQQGGQQQPQPVKRQVEQFVEINSLADNPEMRRRREAFLTTRIMHSGELDTDTDDDNEDRGGGQQYLRGGGVGGGDDAGFGGNSSDSSSDSGYVHKAHHQHHHQHHRSPPSRQRTSQQQQHQQQQGAPRRTTHSNAVNEPASAAGNSQQQQQQQQQHLGEHRDYAAGRHTHQPAQAATVLTAGGTISQHQAQRQAVQQQQQQQRRSQSQLYTDNTSPVPRKTVPIGGGQAGGAQPWAAARRQQQQQQQQFDLVNKYKL